MPGTRPPDRRTAPVVLVGVLLVALASCERRGGCTGDYCGALVFAAAGEPDILLPPVTQQAYARDVIEQIFLKLADLGPSGNTVGDEDFQPLLAERWEWDGPLTLVFHVDPRARWQDGQPVNAADVVFTFDIYTDSLVNSPYRSSLRSIGAVTARDSLTAVFRFRTRYPEMFYDAVYHMRMLPAHLLRTVPRDQWRSAGFGRAPVGSGPYRFVSWKAGQSIELAADSTSFLGRPHIRRLIWRFTPDLQVAVTQTVAGDADAVDVLGPPDNVKRAKGAPDLVTYPYRGAVYGFLGFNLAAGGDTTKPHPLFGDRELRRALAMVVDRQALLKNVWGDLAQVPPGPLARIWSIWDPATRELPYDTAQGRRLLTRLGWRDSDGDGILERDGQPLAFRILVPTTSGLRRQYARLLQQQPRVLAAQAARRGDQDAKGEGLPVPFQDAVAVRVAPAEPGEQAAALRGVVRQLPCGRVPDRPDPGERPGRDLGQVAPHVLQQRLTVHHHRERAAQLTVAEQRMRLVGVAARGQVEPEKAVHRAAVRVGHEVRGALRPLHVVRGAQHVHRIGVAGDGLGDRDLEIGREAPDEPPDVRAPQKRGRVRGELDALARFPADEPVGSAADRRASEPGAAPLVARHRTQEVRGQHPHVVHCVVEHLGVARAEAEHGRERVAGRDGADRAKRGAVRGVDERVGVDVEREHHVRRVDGLPVLPARPRIDVEHERERAVPLPALREQRLKVLVTDRVPRRTQVGELEEDLLEHVPGVRLLGDRGEQDVRLARGGEHERAAVVPGATAAALTGGESDEQDAHEHDRGGPAVRRSCARHRA